MDKKAALIKAWQDAYRQANKKEPPKVEQHGSWLKIDNGNYRLSDLPKMTERLLRRGVTE